MKIQELDKNGLPLRNIIEVPDALYNAMRAKHGTKLRWRRVIERKIPKLK